MNTIRLQSKVVVSVIAVFLLTVFAAAAYADVPNKEIWQRKKKEFGLKDGLSKVKMGDEFQRYTDNMSASQSKPDKNFAERIPYIDRLDGKIDVYIKAVKKKDKKNTAAVQYLEGVQKDLADMKKTLNDILDSGNTVKDLIEKAKTAYARFDQNTDKPALQSFWSQEMRAIGTTTPLLVQRDKVFAPEHKAFKTAINEVKTLVENSPFDPVGTIALIKKSVTDLESGLDEKGAW